VFARIDFSGDAAKAGIQMPPTQMLIFGNPKAGTPLMLAAPSVAIDLPLKALAWEDGGGSGTGPKSAAAKHSRHQGIGRAGHAVRQGPEGPAERSPIG
jgi:hypothetical protein